MVRFKLKRSLPRPDFWSCATNPGLCKSPFFAVHPTSQVSTPRFCDPLAPRIRGDQHPRCRHSPAAPYPSMRQLTHGSRGHLSPVKRSMTRTAGPKPNAVASYQVHDDKVTRSTEQGLACAAIRIHQGSKPVADLNPAGYTATRPSADPRP